jgi:hypothetical protein
MQATYGYDFNSVTLENINTKMAQHVSVIIKMFCSCRMYIFNDDILLSW